MEDQTNNRIREEIINKLQNEWGVDNRESDSFDNWVADLLLSKIDELLKSQRDSIVERIEKAMPSHDAVQKELSLIKEE